MHSTISIATRHIASGLTAVVLLFTVCPQSHAQLSDSLRSELKKVSQLMYQEGNPNYLDVDALCDGIIVPDTKYELSNANGITINNSPLPAWLKPAYEKKFRSFQRLADSSNVMTMISTSSNGLRLKDVFNENSTFRKRKMKAPSPAAMVAANPEADKALYTLVKMLKADKLIDDEDGYDVSYHADGLFVNNVKFSKRKAAKYVAAMKKDGYVLKGKTDGFSTTTSGAGAQK